MKKRILVAPLNWGLGHATRCIPIIKALIENNFEPVIASDGVALSLLKKEFPNLNHIELPAYNVTYARNGKFFKLKLLKDSPRLLQAIYNEKKAIAGIIDKYGISGIISDNRLGVYHKSVPSVFITHQLKVLSGTTTWLSTKMHEKFIKNFVECWVPDTNNSLNLSGKLGHVDTFGIPTKYIGPLSRFENKPLPHRYDLMVLLSGPEPQRTLLEDKLITELKHYKGDVVFVKGIIQPEQTVERCNNFTIYNFMTSQMLEQTINESTMVISRSGYTTLMDLAKLNKKAFFIPTPGQFEQEYLATRLSEQTIVPSCKQDQFTLSKLDIIDQYNGLSAFDFEVDFKKLFYLFEGE
ncbi:glycosyltransferase [Aestuariibaculum sediminum]|uniref:Glycosyltransferase n=1 Tax=Aestuariibaculum sediminum TaxID=2770637 RepID=A0A8J6Q6M9_9FLAO|nr:glycosyltransferase [Aestuariibaculum sediminum]MBD0830930.1 glycosyltransferase [Aestuariibaculum sediminum]